MLDRVTDQGGGHAPGVQPHDDRKLTSVRLQRYRRMENNFPLASVANSEARPTSSKGMPLEEAAARSSRGAQRPRLVGLPLE